MPTKQPPNKGFKKIHIKTPEERKVAERKIADRKARTNLTPEKVKLIIQQDVERILNDREYRNRVEARMEDETSAILRNPGLLKFYEEKFNTSNRSRLSQLIYKEIELKNKAYQIAMARERAQFVREDKAEAEYLRRLKENRDRKKINKII